MSDAFYILSVDGGGFRGLFSAHILKRMEEEWNIDWRTRFGMFAGTSTGSILTAGLACGLSAAKLAQFYKAHGKTIFTPRVRSRFDFLRILTSRYSNETLRTLLEKELGSSTLAEVSVPLILPSVDIGNGCVHVFKSKYSDRFVRDGDVRVSDAVLASCSAPTYFDPHIVGATYELADGGLWANNPSLVAAIDAYHHLNIPLDQLRVLSIGTGAGKVLYPRQPSLWRDRIVRRWQGWGFATRWQRSKLLDLILNLQSDAAHNMLYLLLKEPSETNRVCRVTFESDQPLPMDSIHKQDDWIGRADYVFTHNAARVAKFLGISGDKS